VVLPLSLFYLENHVCLSRGVQWQVRHGGQRQGSGMVTQVGYLVAGQSRGRVAPCAVCTVHVDTRSVGFLVEPQNQGQRFVNGLASKPLE
jgi:DNA-binding transcriptional regulator of glucitol operon